jgi:hypothetical protein
MKCGSADLPGPFGDIVGHSKDLRAVFVEQEVVVTKMTPAHVPMKILGSSGKARTRRPANVAAHARSPQHPHDLSQLVFPGCASLASLIAFQHCFPSLSFSFGFF